MKQYFYLVVKNYDECTVPCKIFLQEKEAIVWGRRKASVVLAETKDSNYEFSLYKQEITRNGELQFVKPLYPYPRKELVDAGVYRVIVGTQAITNPSFLEELATLNQGPVKYADHIVIAIDVLDEVIKYSGWLESSPIKLVEYIDKCLALGFFRFLCTDISKDGKLGGAGVELYKKLLEHSPIIKLIGSGGISSMKDIEDLNDLGRIESVVVGKAIYENKITIEEIKDWNLKSLIKF